MFSVIADTQCFVFKVLDWDRGVFVAVGAYETVTLFTYPCPCFVKDLRGRITQLVFLLSLQDKDPNCNDTSKVAYVKISRFPSDD